MLRIKTFEQTKLHNPEELGKLIGYDRIPEVKTFRGMINELTAQGKCEDWGKTLSTQWISSEEPELYYVDGHVQVYHGYLAELGKKHVSRQRPCLPDMMEFWIDSLAKDSKFSSNKHRYKQQNIDDCFNRRIYVRVLGTGEFLPLYATGILL